MTMEAVKSKPGNKLILEKATKSQMQRVHAGLYTICN
jgi:hypothetical protein